MPIEVAEDSEWFDPAEVRRVEWSTSGKWVYAKGYGYSDAPTTFTLEIRWSGEPYQAMLSECDDGSRGANRPTIPVLAHLTTSDGAFDDVFRATPQVIVESPRVVYDFERLPANERHGNFMLPASADFDCESPELGGYRISFDAEQHTGTVQRLESPGYSWLHWICTPSWYPIGRPEFERVTRP